MMKEELENGSSPSSTPWLCVGHYGKGNLGDAAMLQGLLNIIKDAGSLAVVGSESDESLLEKHPVVLRVCQLRSVRILSEVARCQGIIVGGGTHFVDSGHRGFRRLIAIRYQAYWTLLAALARLLGKPVCWLGIGVGPVKTRATAFLLRQAMKKSVVVARDQGALDEIQRIVKPASLSTGFDLAPLSLDIAARTRREDVLGLSFSTIHGSRLGHPPLDHPFWSSVGNCLHQILIENPELRLRFFVVSVGPREPDERLTSQIINEIPGELRNRVELIRFDGDTQSMYQKMTECRAFLASRYHALLLAAWAGCEIGVFSYARKMADLARQLEIPDRDVLDLRDPDEPAAHALLTRLLRGSCHTAPVNVIERLENLAEANRVEVLGSETTESPRAS